MATDYGADYYGHYAADGVSYERNAFWLDFFRKIADPLIEDFSPKTTLDAGCAIGLLVEARLQRIRHQPFARGHPAIPEGRIDYRAARQAL